MYCGGGAVFCDVGVAVCVAYGCCDVAGAVGLVIPAVSPPIVSDALLKMEAS